MSGEDTVIRSRLRTGYYAARMMGQLSQNLLLAAILVAAGTSSQAAINLSSVFVAIMIPAIALGPLGGAVADRLGASRGMVLGAFLRTSVAVAGLLLLLGGGHPWLVAFAYSAVSQIFTPAEMAMVRSIQASNAGRAHSLLVTLQYIGQFLGMIVLAPPLYLLGGLAALYIGAIAGFGLITAFTLVLNAGMAMTPGSRLQPAQAAFSFRETLAFLASEHRAQYAVVALGFKTIVSRVVFLALPIYLAHDMGVDRSLLVYLVAPGVVGVIVALAWCGKSMTLERAHDVMRLSFLGMIVSVFALAALDFGITLFAQYSQVPPVAHLEASINTTFGVAIPVAFLLGMSLTASMIAARVAVTETAPVTQQARVFAVQETLSETLVIAPLLLAGIGTQYAGARPVLATVGAIALIAFVGLELVGRRALRPASAPAQGQPLPALQASSAD